MIPKVRLVFDRKAKAGNNKCEGDVEVYVYHNGKKRYLSTGVRVRKREYNDGTISVRADAVELNRRLQWCLRNVQEQINQMVEDDNVDVRGIELRLNDRSANFIDWMESVAEGRNVAEGTKNTYRCVIRDIRRFGQIVTMADVTLDNIEEYEHYMRYRRASSRRLYHARLKFFIKMAIKKGLIAKNPYDDYDLPKQSRIETIKYLRDDERRLVEDVEATGRLAMAKDMFLLSCYTGLRYSDIIKINRDCTYKYNDSLWLRDKQKKTGREFNILLLPAAIEILERYEWNMNRLSIGTLDNLLKEIALVAGIRKRLTMHMARHTFATWALSQGVRVEVVSKMLAHADISTTLLYAKVLQKDVVQGYEKLSSCFDKK